MKNYKNAKNSSRTLKIMILLTLTMDPSTNNMVEENI